MLGDKILPLDESGKFGMQKKHLCYYFSSSSGILSHSLIRSYILAKTNSETPFKMMVGFWRTFPASMMNRGEKKQHFLKIKPGDFTRYQYQLGVVNTLVHRVGRYSIDFYQGNLFLTFTGPKY